MQTACTIVVLTALFLLGCQRDGTSTSATPLSLYVVSEEKVDGGRYIDAPGLQKLGYIASTPDLVITRLRAVVPDVSHEQSTMVDTNGNKTELPLRTRPALTIRMHSNDAKSFRSLTEQAVGKRVLIMLGETPLVAPMVHSPIQTESIVLTFGEMTDNNTVENELKKLVK